MIARDYPVEHPVVGQRYVLRPRPVEWQCPGCGHVAGTDRKEKPWKHEMIVLVLKAADSFVFCSLCGHRSLLGSDGWWVIWAARSYLGGNVVPWTWLFPLAPDAPAQAAGAELSTESSGQPA
jgi:hypothetical protein